ncbi:hypothetical protein INS90_08980 [Trueperella pecoris]|uniref:Uncharacterized protein n=1 Tax=Trueperella pecoris TaxID=2733571 RepID=A0A7M1R1G0_9ACTO|nr:hypothetical protein [Trueperella pecoris]QOR47375.1 hypothetical protein INS90_08980 [Trueperella pecoris]
MHRSFRPHNPWALIGIFLAHALITWFLATAPTRSWIPVDSRGIVVSLRENTFIIGLVGATIGFSLGRYFLPTSVILGRSKARSAKEIAHGLIVPVLTSQIAGYLIGALAALASVNYHRATEGVLPLIAIFLGLASLTTWGFLVGSTLRHIWGALALVAITLSFVYAPLIANSYIIPNSTFPARPLGMVWAINEPSADLTFNTWAEVARSLFYLMMLAIGVLLFSVFSRKASVERSVSKLSLVTTMTLAVVSISSIAVVLVPEPFKKDGVPLFCQHSENLNICQYQIYKPLIPKIFAIGEKFSAVAPEETILAVPATERHPSAVPIPQPRRSEQGWERAIAQSYADYLAGVTSCFSLRENGQLASEDSLHKSLDLSKELLRRAKLEGLLPASQTSTFAQNLSKLPPAEFSQWFFDNADAIKACAITE